MIISVVANQAKSDLDLSGIIKKSLAIHQPENQLLTEKEWFRMAQFYPLLGVVKLRCQESWYSHALSKIYRISAFIFCTMFCSSAPLEIQVRVTLVGWYTASISACTVSL